MMFSYVSKRSSFDNLLQKKRLWSQSRGSGNHPNGTPCPICLVPDRSKINHTAKNLLEPACRKSIFLPAVSRVQCETFSVSVLTRIFTKLGSLNFDHLCSCCSNETKGQSWKFESSSRPPSTFLSLSLCLSFSLESFSLEQGAGRVGLAIANFVIQKCPNLRRISRLRSWGRVSRKQVIFTCGSSSGLWIGKLLILILFDFDFCNNLIRLFRWFGCNNQTAWWGYFGSLAF